MRRPKEVLVKDHEILFDLHYGPCDRAIRAWLDPIDPENLRLAFKQLFSRLQRDNGHKHLAAIDGYYQVAVDGAWQN